MTTDIQAQFGTDDGEKNYCQAISDLIRGVSSSMAFEGQAHRGPVAWARSSGGIQTWYAPMSPNFQCIIRRRVIAASRK
jgi:hypothetical protein